MSRGWSTAFSETGGDISGVVETLEGHGMEVRGLDAELEEGSARYTVQLRVPPRQNVQDALRETTALPNVRPGERQRPARGRVTGAALEPLLEHDRLAVHRLLALPGP